MDPNLIAFLKLEIRKQVNIILSGQAGTNTQFTETIENLFPGMPGIIERPVMHPYGISSRAPRGTIQVTGRQGDHFGNRIILGHRDANRPSMNEGETVIYNQFGRAIRVVEDAILVGGEDSAENIVLGQVFKSLMSNLLGALQVERHIDSLGYTTAVPVNAGTYASLQASPVNDEAVLSDESFARKSGGT